jgi:uncharacterized sporulation protein YeaH/YhbH (DUF444 family)
MGAGNSKNVAEKVVKKARPMIKQGTPSDVKTPRTIQANLSRQDIENMSQKAECQGDNNEFLQLEDVVKKPQASGKKTNQIQLLEMKEELLKDFQQFKDFDRVEYLTVCLFHCK